ncbi:MAG: hypothetical protein ACRDKW_06105 [Actinomycetota bacterium]
MSLLATERKEVVDEADTGPVLCGSGCMGKSPGPVRSASDASAAAVQEALL